MATERGSGNPSVVFFVLGLAFIAIGASQNRAFLFVGIAFLAIGSVRVVQSRRSR